MTNSGSAESGMTDSGIAKFEMIGRIGPKTCPKTRIRLEIIGSRNMESTGVATLGQM